MIRWAALLAAVLAAGCSQTTGSTTTAMMATNAGSQASVRAYSGNGSATMMTTKGYAFAPPAFYKFCAAQPRLCSTRGETKAVKLTSARRADLEKVNRSVNHRIRERNDYGLEDDWRLAVYEGDCEDFAIAKKAELLKRGWPASALLLTVATLGGQGHTVLTVRTDGGDLILDNRTDAVKDWSRTPYRYFARQSQSAPGKWTRIGEATPVS